MEKVVEIDLHRLDAEILHKLLIIIRDRRYCCSYSRSSPME